MCQRTHLYFISATTEATSTYFLLTPAVRSVQATLPKKRWRKFLFFPHGCVISTASSLTGKTSNREDTCYKKAKKIIEDHMEQLHASAALLMEKEKIGREEFESLFDADNNQADSLTNEETV